jgi:3-phenylpropionate/trans-cinnamate dioxygenase ferredoxin reductase component
MTAKAYHYIIVGAGLAGASAVSGIRELDQEKSILLVGSEKHLPYDRPPLSKALWMGKKQVAEIFLHPSDYYAKNKIQVALETSIVSVAPKQKVVVDDDGKEYRYEKLLLATGGSPRKLDLPGAELEGICYYRTIDDYSSLRSQAVTGKTAVVIGGGFIGSEIAAALKSNGVNVTMIFPDDYLCQKVFPESLGLVIQEHFREKGITILSGDTPVSFSKQDEKFHTLTKQGNKITSDMVVIGAGIAPEIELAQRAKLTTSNGIAVNEYLQTSAADIYAAGDNSFFPCRSLGKSTRMEHWDNALNQGRQAGRNMVDAEQSYDYLPYFFSDLFEFGYEAVGEVDSRLQIVADWKEGNRIGVIYYLDNKKVRGVMLCNIWDKVAVARQLIEKGDIITDKELRGAIR